MKGKIKRPYSGSRGVNLPNTAAVCSVPLIYLLIGAFFYDGSAYSLAGALLIYPCLTIALHLLFISFAGAKSLSVATGWLLCIALAYIRALFPPESDSAELSLTFGTTLYLSIVPSLILALTMAIISIFRRNSKKWTGDNEEYS